MNRKLWNTLCVIAASCVISSPVRGFAQYATPEDRARAGALMLIPPDATAALIAHPRAILTSPILDVAPRELLSAFVKEQLDFDPLDVEFVVAAVKLRGPEDYEFSVAWKLRSGPTFRSWIESITAEFAGRGRQVPQINGRPYFAVPGGALAFHFPSDSSAVFGTDAMVRRMIRREGKPTAPIHRYLAAGPATQLQLVAAVKPARRDLLAQLQQLPRLPEGLETLKRVPELVELLDIRIDTTPFRYEIALHATDNAAAEMLDRTFQRALATGKSLATDLMEQQLSGQLGFEQAGRAYAKRMIDAVIGKLQPERNGTKLTFRRQHEAAYLAAAATIMLPATVAAIEAERRNRAVQKGKEIMIGLLSFHDAHKRYPAHAIYDKAGAKPLLSWRVHLLPYLEEEQLYHEFHLDEPWDSPHNRKLIARMPQVYAHNGEDPRGGRTHFLGVLGDTSRFFVKGQSQGRTMRSLQNLTQTIGLVEADRGVIWTKPEDYEVAPDDPVKGLGNLRPGGNIIAMMCDGAVRAFSRHNDVQELKRLLDIAWPDR